MKEIKEIIESPFADGNAKLHKKKIKMQFRKQEYSVWDFYYVCEKTKKEFSTPEIGNLTLMQLYNQYREEFNILFPEQITKMRERYGLSAAKMSKVLDFGPNTYSNYEKGEIPNGSNAKILRIANEPQKFLDDFIFDKKKLFTVNELKVLNDKTKKLIDDENTKGIFFGSIYNLWNENLIPNENTGYRAPSFIKFAHMVIFFCKEDSDRAYASRINKLLFYSDMLNYRQTCFSISGCTYHANRFGTVPIRADIALGILEESNFIYKEPRYITSNGEVKEAIVPLKPFEKDLFTESEFNNLAYIYNGFKNYSTQELIDEINHEEKAWIDLKDERKRISYQKYAFDIQGIK